MRVDSSGLTTGEKKIANKIEQIYKGSNSNAYLYFQPRIKKYNPDFILVDQHKGVSIIEVKDWSLQDIDETNQLHFIINKTQRHNPLFITNEYFNTAKSRMQNQISLLDDNYNLKYGLYSNLVLTNIKSRELEEWDSCFFQPPTKCITTERITNLVVDDLFSEEERYINDYDFSIIRSTFFPEIKVKSVQKELWEFGRKNTTENSIIKTLDVEQEKFAKRLPYGHYMVSGIPGSGKTVILLARAINLIREHPNWKVKIITYNTTLATKLKHKLESIYEDLDVMGVNYQNIDISTFHSLAKSVADVGIVPDPTPENYWDVILPFKAIENARPTYDAILIDEYQDFLDVWLKLCLKLCVKHEYNNQETENLFLAGDRLQSIYNPSTHNWKSLGINIAGRSKLLKTSYRSGSTHINLALDYLMNDSSTRREVENFYEGRKGICCDFDIENSVEFVKGDFKVLNDLLDELLKNPNYNPEDILVLVPNNWLRNKLYKLLDKSLKVNSVASKYVLENKMNFVTYHSAKGIESKVCVLIDVDKVKDKKLLYVGMTRASEKLIIHSPDQDGGPVFNELLKCYDQMTCEATPVIETKAVASKKGNTGVSESNAYKKWLSAEDKLIVKMHESGERTSEIAVRMKRKEGEVKRRLKHLGAIKG